jgi:hypothetical protein
MSVSSISSIELHLYLLDEIKSLLVQTSNKNTLETLAKTYIELTRELSTCPSKADEEYNVAYISAVGLCALLAKNT